MSMSIVDVGASLSALLDAKELVVRGLAEGDEGVFREEEDVELRIDLRVVLEGIAGRGFGVKAEESTAAIPAAGQVVVILSGKAGSSIVKTSSAGERRPRRLADCMSSCFRVSPRPSAFPKSETPISLHLSWFQPVQSRSRKKVLAGW